MKKVFTKVLGIGTLSIGAGSEIRTLDSWVAQEDELILGYTYTCRLLAASENDGLSGGLLDLSQAASISKDGSLGLVNFLEYWNTAPPFGEVNAPSGSVFFAAGKEISLSEGDYLSLFSELDGKSAGMSIWSIWFTVYYTKKGK